MKLKLTTFGGWILKRTFILMGVVGLFFGGYRLSAKDSGEICFKIKQNITAGSLLVLAEDNLEVLCSINPNKSFIPASLIKIPAALALLEELGADFQFETNFWLDEGQNLILEGVGDPFLTSEEIAKIAEKLQADNWQRFNRLLINHQRFDKIVIPGVVDSLEPYDALNTAVIVNFNTVYVSLGSDGKKVISAEEQTPLTPIAKQYAQKYLTPGTTNRLNLGNDLEVTLNYAGQLLTAIFAQHQITFATPKPAIQNSIPANARLIYRHYNSRKLTQLLALTLKYSNNMQINQMMLLLGAKKFGFPANLKKGATALNEALAELVPGLLADVTIFEASGISSQNRASAQGLMKALIAFAPHFELLPRKNNNYVKSGTLKNVYNYGGYIPTAEGMRKFVLILNQSANNRDKILSLILRLP